MAQVRRVMRICAVALATALIHVRAVRVDDDNDAVAEVISLREDPEKAASSSQKEDNVSAASEKDKGEFLSAINMYRCMHGSAPATWNDEIAAALRRGRTRCLP